MVLPHVTHSRTVFHGEFSPTLGHSMMEQSSTVSPRSSWPTWRRPWLSASTTVRTTLESSSTSTSTSTLPSRSTEVPRHTVRRAPWISDRAFDRVVRLVPTSCCTAAASSKQRMRRKRRAGFGCGCGCGGRSGRHRGGG